MSALLDQLRAMAFMTASALEANEAIADARDQVGFAHASGTSYELVLDPGADEAQLRATLIEGVLPRWVYFLNSRGMGFPQSAGLVASIFIGDTLHFVHGAHFSEWLVTLSGKTAAQLKEEHKA